LKEHGRGAIKLAKVLGISHMLVARIWRRASYQPHQLARYCCLMIRSSKKYGVANEKSVRAQAGPRTR
jgi:hypothetical protein